MSIPNIPSLKDVVKNEYKKCATDCVYFLKKYAVLQHPMRGKIAFQLYDYQSKTLEHFQNSQYNIVLKARQIGLSSLTAGYSLWMMLFHSDKNILVIATKQETAKNLVTKVKVMHQNLPVWLRGKCIEDNKLSLRFANGSQIKAVASSKDAGRSEALSLLILDECAFIDDAEDIWTASVNTLSTGGKAILLSTPNGIGNFFHKKWIEATESEGSYKFNPITLDWRVHPERDQAWRDKQDEIQGKRAASQEHDCDFISSGDTFIPGELILEYKKEMGQEPAYKQGIDGNIWVWKVADYSKHYIVSADCARGDGLDKSGFHVFDTETCEQVAEYRGEIGTKDFGNLLVAIATQYNDALLVVENSNIGWNTVQTIIDREYKNLFYTVKDLHYVDAESQRTNKYYQEEKKKVPGFTTSIRTRPLILSKMYDYMKEKSVILHSIRLIDELLVFIWNGDKPEAREGYNDDLVISLAIALWVRDTALRLRQEGIDITKLALDKITKSKHDQIYTPKMMPEYNPWQLGIGKHDKEDLTEFL